MKIIDFIDRTEISNKSETEKAKLLCLYHYKENGEQQFSITNTPFTSCSHHKKHQSKYLCVCCLVPNSPNADISVHIEGNNEQGAWDKEGRIHYYGALSDLENTFEDLFNCSSAGTRNITRRINSNGYILSLINDYYFKIKTYSGYTTADIFPPELEIVENNLRKHLMNLKLSNTHINTCFDVFYDGYNL